MLSLLNISLERRVSDAVCNLREFVGCQMTLVVVGEEFLSEFGVHAFACSVDHNPK